MNDIKEIEMTGTTDPEMVSHLLGKGFSLGEILTGQSQKASQNIKVVKSQKRTMNKEQKQALTQVNEQIKLLKKLPNELDGDELGTVGLDIIDQIGFLLDEPVWSSQVMIPKNNKIVKRLNKVIFCLQNCEGAELQEALAYEVRNLHTVR